MTMWFAPVRGSQSPSSRQGDRRVAVVRAHHFGRAAGAPGTPGVSYAARAVI